MLAARAGGDARVALAALERAAEAAARRGRRRDRRRGGRGRAAAQGAALRPRGRPPLRLHLGLDQGDPRLGRRRLPLLPRGDARGRRGPALHRPPDGDLRLRGHRQRRPAGARGRQPPRHRPSTASGCPECALNLAQAAAYLALAPKSNASTRAISRAIAHVREHGAAEPPPLPPGRPLSRRPRARPRARATAIRHDEPGGVTDQPLAPEALARRALLRAHRPRLRGRARRRAWSACAGRLAGDETDAA